MASQRLSGQREYCLGLANEGARQRCLESDWTKEKLAVKIEQIRKVVFSQDGRPNILVATEVDNERAVKPLAEHLGYSHWIVTSSPDERGMNVAVLFDGEHPHFKYVRHDEHLLQGGVLVKPTRNILEVRFQLATGQYLTIFGNHWPSQGAPSVVRMAAAKRLRDLVDRRMAENSEELIAALGDFNVIEKDRPDPFFDEIMSPYWVHRFRDLDTDHREMLRGLPSNNGNLPLDLIPPGTYFYAPTMELNVLDRIFYNSNLSLKDKPDAKVFFDVQSYKIVADPLMRTEFRYGTRPQDCTDYFAGSVVRGVPKAYNWNSTSIEDAGYSDHFAVMARLKLKL